LRVAPLWEVFVASAVASLGVTLLLAAVAGAPPRRAARRLMAPSVALCGLAATAAVTLALLGMTLPALAAGGVTLCAAAALVALVRARPDDGDVGRGGDDEPPDEPPGGPDWDEFEAAFWAYVERAPVA
jgi:hypothetical protein